MLPRTRDNWYSIFLKKKGLIFDNNSLTVNTCKEKVKGESVSIYHDLQCLNVPLRMTLQSILLLTSCHSRFCDVLKIAEIWLDRGLPQRTASKSLSFKLAERGFWAVKVLRYAQRCQKDVYPSLIVTILQYCNPSLSPSCGCPNIIFLIFLIFLPISCT